MVLVCAVTIRDGFVVAWDTGHWPRGEGNVSVDDVRIEIILFRFGITISNNNKIQ